MFTGRGGQHCGLGMQSKPVHRIWLPRLGPSGCSRGFGCDSSDWSRGFGFEFILRLLLEARGGTNLRNEWAHTQVDAAPARSQLSKAGGKGLGPREDGSGGLLQPCIDLLQRSSTDTDTGTGTVQ